MVINSIVLIGAGNVATQLGKAFQRHGKAIVQVLGRNQRNAELLGDQVGASAISNPYQLTTDADLYIFAVPDDEISKIANSFSLGDQLVVNTSGSMGIDVLKNVSSRYGVFYPLQTFSKSRDIDFSDIPICIEACCDEVCDSLTLLANQISKDVRKIDSEQRQSIHLAAVFASNFTNHIYHLADEILKDAGVSFDIIQPLIIETANKIQHKSPKESQTGPAVRGDMKIIKKHLELLKSDSNKKELYNIISELIMGGR